MQFAIAKTDLYVGPKAPFAAAVKGEKFKILFQEKNQILVCKSGVGILWSDVIHWEITE